MAWGDDVGELFLRQGIDGCEGVGLEYKNKRTCNRLHVHGVIIYVIDVGMILINGLEVNLVTEILFLRSLEYYMIFSILLNIPGILV